MEKLKSDIFFGDEKVRKLFLKSKSDKKIIKWLSRAFEDLEKNPFSGIQIPKKLIPKEYKKRFGKLNNLWKYNLPDAWRLIYTIKRDDVIILSIILEWMPHKEYNKRFKY